MTTIERTSGDADEIEALNRTAGWDARYVRLKPGSFRGRSRERALGEVLVVEEEFDGALQIVGQPPAGCVAIGLPFEVSASTRWLRRRVGPRDLVSIPESRDLDILSGPHRRHHGPTFRMATTTERTHPAAPRSSGRGPAPP